MKRTAFTIIGIFICMSMQPVVANSVAPNDSQTVSGNVNVLSVDGFVTTKFASVGSEVDIQAHTRGHSSSTYVSADIVKYDIDPLDSMINSAFPGSGQFLDRVVLTAVGVHEDDSNTMVWQGTYTVPVSSTGGMYGASIIAEDGNLRAVDDPVQVREIFRKEVEDVLQAIDYAWVTANPTSLIAGEFLELEQKGTANGGWSNFVATATEGSGTGGSQQLWDAMINAGHTQYNMSAGANFLETLMVYLASEDVDASLSFLTGVLLYADNFPLPNTFDDFDEAFEYIQTFGLVENFTSLEGTAEFEVAYNALIGSNEWTALEQAIENLANNEKPFESIQIIMRNIALLSVSTHPEAISSALDAWVQPLAEGDFENMTPFQQFIVRFAEMAGELNSETDIQDTDEDGIPEIITWQYEYLLQTTEGQAWTAKMETSSSWVNDAFTDFNSLPEDAIGHIITSFEDPAWSNISDALAEFGDWMSNATRSQMEVEWPSNEDEGEDENDGDSATESSEPEYVIFDGLNAMQTMAHDSHLLEVGIKLRFDTDGDCEGHTPRSDEEWRNEEFSISMTNERGDKISTELINMNQWEREYVGVLLAPNMDITSWTLSQPLEDYTDCEISSARMMIDRSLRSSMIGAMAWENNDEVFMVSSLGVLVEQDEIVQIGSPVTITSQTYDSAGVFTNAEADIAIVRISPQLGESAASTLSPEGEHDLTVNYPDTFQGTYTGQDLDGDMNIEIMAMGEYRDDNNDRNHPQSYDFENIEINSNGVNWDASNYLPSQRGVVDVVISGTTDEGLQFSEMKQMPLPGSLGCTLTEGSADGHNVNLGYNYRAFEADDGERFYRPDLDSVTVSWGDGTSTNYPQPDSGEEEPSGWEGHNYANSGEYNIQLEYKDEYGMTHTDDMRYDTDQGFWQEDSDSEEGGYWTGWKSGADCWLESEESNLPTPEIIDNFITGGPVEVITEQVMEVDANGIASLTFSPNHPGMYISIVQSKAIMTTGETKIGIGLNFVYVTQGSLEIEGLTLVTSFSGLPVYTLDNGASGLQTLTVKPTGISMDEYNVTLGVAPLRIDVAFPDVDWDSLGVPETYDIEFQQGDTYRTQDVRFNAPISFIGAAITAPDDAIELEAAHFGIVLNNPDQLDMVGPLGPGQTTNVKLDQDSGEATRILSVAAPKEGFDPATIDFASFTSFIYDEAVRPELGWIAADEESVEICETIVTDQAYSPENGASYYRIKLSQNYGMSEYKVLDDIIDTANTVLEDEDGNEIQPVSNGGAAGWSQEDVHNQEKEMVAYFDLDPDTDYRLRTGTEIGTEFDVRSYENNHEESCGSDEEMTDDEAFDMFDDLFGNVKSIAWGIGSSADLKLPHLASPASNYTVLALVQQGSGNSATISAAIGSQVAEPNPVPLEMKNLTLDFMPDNPSTGDMLQITATDSESGVPVADLSALLLLDGATEDSATTDYNGQASFLLPGGQLIIRVSGGMYNAAEFVINVTTSGTVIEDLPDWDGDGISDEFDSDDDNDGVFDIDDLCERTPIGTIVGSDGCPSNNLDSDGDGVMDSDDMCPNTAEGDVVESDGCVKLQLIDDADSDGVVDANDLCSDTAVGEEVNVDGCSLSQLIILEDNNSEVQKDEVVTPVNNDSDSVSGTSDGILGMDMMTIGAIGGGVLVLAILSLMFIRRGGGDDDHDWNYDDEDDMMFEPTSSHVYDSPEINQYQEPVPIQSGPPKGPPPSHQGYMNGGYEVTEYPEGSGSWWWKDSATGKWSEWTS